jgi:RNA-directed DNA polymerase
MCFTEREREGTGVSLIAPKTKLEELRGKLYARAKTEPTLRFYSLYDKIYRKDVLVAAFKQAKSNHGAAGVDGQTFEMIEEYGEERWLLELQKQLQEKTYQPLPVRKVLIPKPGGGERPLGIPTIKDRVAQTAAKLILEPIFEADLSKAAYGYRPERNAVQAVEEVQRLLKEGRTEVVDADLAQYFDRIPHAELMLCLARRIGDGAVLHLIKLWLKAPVEERDEQKRPRMGGGKGSTQGVPQGGVLSPLLANVYINRLLKVFAQSEYMERCGARIVNYADDFVVLCHQNATGVLEKVAAWLVGMKLELNPTKTSVKKATKEPFVFLGYELGLQRYFKTRTWYFGLRPSKKAMGQFREKVGQSLRRGRSEPWAEIRDELNARLRGWMQYYLRGSTAQPYTQLDQYVFNRVRNLMRRRHRLPIGTARFNYEEVHQRLGVVELEKLWLSQARA